MKSINEQLKNKLYLSSNVQPYSCLGSYGDQIKYMSIHYVY